MRQHDNPVFGDGKIRFERRHADFERFGKTGKRILGRQPSRATMALQVEGRYGDGGNCCQETGSDTSYRRTNDHSITFRLVMAPPDWLAR
jgi:hypothetical protein